MEKYLRPETLFGTKFEGYLNQTGSKKTILIDDANKVVDWNQYIDV